MSAPPPKIKWWPLPKRDMLLLPLIAIGTIAALLLPAEFVIRSQHPAELVDQCTIGSKSPAIHGRPNCVSRTKAAEGPWVTNSYNECGYRNPESCGPKPAGTLRVAMIGSSTSAGYLTAYDDSMAARTARTLTAQCKRPVEFQNLSAAGNLGKRVVASASEAMALDPDAIVLAVDPFDFEPSGAGAVVGGGPVPQRNLLRRIRDRVSASSLLYMESYLLLRDDASYVPLYLGLGHGADFMRSPLPKGWRRQVEMFDASVAQIAALAKARSVPFLIVFIPQRAQASLASSRKADPNFHPFAFPALLNTIALRHGAAFVDATREIAPGTPSSRIFYPVNGHINAQGHALASHAIVDRLTSAAMAPFADKCRSR
jgi:hypothetical protein